MDGGTSMAVRHWSWQNRYAILLVLDIVMSLVSGTTHGKYASVNSPHLCEADTRTNLRQDLAMEDSLVMNSCAEWATPHVLFGGAPLTSSFGHLGMLQLWRPLKRFSCEPHRWAET